MREIAKLVSLVLRPRLFLIIFVFLPYVSCIDNSAAERIREAVINDLPHKGDLEIFLPVLERILNYVYKNKNYIHPSLAFGLHLVHENLKLMFSKQIKIPRHVEMRLSRLLEKNKEDLKYFKETYASHFNMVSLKDLDILMLFAPMTLPTLHLNLLNETEWYTVEKLQEIYGEPATYMEKAMDFTKSLPSPPLSDACLEVLSYNFKEKGTAGGFCYSPDFCIKMLLNGDDYGYFITHRLLFLSIANLSVKCRLFSETHDKLMANRMCAKIYNEAEYIVANDYVLADLLMEQMTLCTLNGDLQFLRRSWLLNLIRFQSNYGCMGEFNDNGSKLSEWTLRKTNTQQQQNQIDFNVIRKMGDILDGKCNVHVTSVGAAIFSTAIRHILQTYYRAEQVN